MIRTILIDDEAPARDELRYLLTTHHYNTVDIIGEADNATKAITLITQEQPDLIFLDIQMRGLTGLELAEVIKTISPHSFIIFATAYDEYALKAFELQALDYVVKPIEEDRLAQAIARAGQFMPSTDAMSSSTNATSHIPLDTKSTNNPTFAMEKIAVEYEGRIILIDSKSIYYITGESGHLEVHTKTGIYTIHKTLTELQDRFKGSPLMRVHRSFIVNLAEVKEVIPWFKGTYWLRLPEYMEKQIQQATEPKSTQKRRIQGTTSLVDIPVSKSLVKEVKDLLGIR